MRSRTVLRCGRCKQKAHDDMDYAGFSSRYIQYEDDYLAPKGMGRLDRSDRALLRLEIASEVPTPAEHLSAKRLLQLQMLTRRNAASPEQTWGERIEDRLAAK